MNRLVVIHLVLELQKFVVEALASKSKLSEKDAMVLGEKVSYGVLRELKEKKLV